MSPSDLSCDSSVSTPGSKWITLSDSWPIIDPSWWITQPWGRENWALRWPVNIKWRCLQSVRALHNGPQCDIVPAQTRGWHLEFFTIPPLRLCDNNPELLPAPACVIHNGRRKFVFSSIQRCCHNVQLWNLVLCVHFVQLSVSRQTGDKKLDGVVTNKPLAAVYSFIYQRPWLQWRLCGVVWLGTKTSNNSFLSSS